MTQWRDLHDDDPAGRWWGLTFQRPDVARASLRLQAARALLRLEAHSDPVLWARVASDYGDYDYLVARETWERGLEVIPPLSFDQVHCIEQHAAQARPGQWARELATALLCSATSPVDRDTCVLVRCDAYANRAARPYSARIAAPSLDDWQQVAEQARTDVSRWSFSDLLPPLSLRDPKRIDAGRVHAWRKAVRAETAPPVLLWWLSGLDRFVILDGLHRAFASLAEGIAPQCLALMRFGALGSPLTTTENIPLTRGIEQALFPQAGGKPAITVDNANRMLVEAYDTRPGVDARSSAWPILGGPAAWRREVRRELTPSEAVESGLLYESEM